MLSKIWKDPVWSKIIASSIIGATLLIYAAIQERTKAISFTDTFESIINLKLKLSHVLICLLIFYISKWTLSTVFKEKSSEEPSIYSKKQKQLQTFNKIEDKEAHILCRWEVYFNTSGKPFIGNLNAFCLNHGDIPIRFIHGRCPQINCENHRNSFSESIAKNHIESILINDWDKLNS